MSEDAWTDDQWIAAIDAAADPAQRIDLIHQFYRDHNRAERQPRALLYLHIGFLCGTVLQLLDPRR